MDFWTDFWTDVWTDFWTDFRSGCGLGISVPAVPLGPGASLLIDPVTKELVLNFPASVPKKHSSRI